MLKNLHYLTPPPHPICGDHSLGSCVCEWYPCHNARLMFINSCGLFYLVSLTPLEWTALAGSDLLGVWGGGGVGYCMLINLIIPVNPKGKKKNRL